MSNNKLYIGQNEVAEYNEDVAGRMTYTLANGQKGEVTTEQFLEMSKPEAYDDAMVRVNKWLPAIREMATVLLKNDMTLLEKDFVLGRLDETLVQNYGKAVAKLFGARDEFEGNITLSQIDKVLKS